jgi:hypothetical protein
MSEQHIVSPCYKTNRPPPIFLSEEQSIELFDALIYNHIEFFAQSIDLLQYPYLYFHAHFCKQLLPLFFGTPLIFIIIAIGSPAIINLILPYFLNNHILDEDLRGISHFLTFSDDVELFSKYIHPNCFLQKDSSDLTPLHYCCIHNSLSILDFFINQSLDLNLIANFRNPFNLHDIRPIHLAALYGHLEMLKILFENGANISAHTREGFNVFHFAIVSESLSLVEFLFERKLMNYQVFPIDFDNYFHQKLLFTNQLRFSL